MRVLRRIAIGLVLALLVVSPAMAQDFIKGLAAYEQDDYAGALREWRPLAEKGHAKAQFNLAMLHAEGHGVPHNDVLGYMWFELSFAHGYKRAKLGIAAVSKVLTAAEIAEAKKLARAWRAKHPMKK
jgi:TPR repeat protein